MFGLDFCDFDNFLFLDLSLRCHKALSNLFSHLHEFNLVVAALTHLKISKKKLCNQKAIFNMLLYLMLNKPNYRKSQLNQSLSTQFQLKYPESNIK